MVKEIAVSKEVYSSKKMTMKDITEKAKAELLELTGFPASSVVSVAKEGETWKVMVELLEKKGIPDNMDTLGLYQTKIDGTGDFLEYERKSLRKRGDTAGQEIDETAE
jgi:hypothetical protein